MENTKCSNESPLSFCNGRLSYCGQDCSRIPQALGKMYGPRVQCLDLSFNSLVSLRGLEGFTRLEELVLDNNQLGDSLVLPYLPHLTTLSLNNNQITDLELLLDKISLNIPCLTYLSILSNKACPNQLSDADKDDSDYQRYRYFVLHKLPALRFLDSRRVGSDELAEGRARGHLMRVRRPPPAPPAPPLLCQPPPPPPLASVAGKHRGAFGKCNYKYTGKHSEGNRFIVNSDL